MNHFEEEKIRIQFVSFQELKRYVYVGWQGNLPHTSPLHRALFHHARRGNLKVVDALNTIYPERVWHPPMFWRSQYPTVCRKGSWRVRTRKEYISKHTFCQWERTYKDVVIFDVRFQCWNYLYNSMRRLHIDAKFKFSATISKAEKILDTAIVRNYSTSHLKFHQL